MLPVTERRIGAVLGVLSLVLFALGLWTLPRGLVAIAIAVALWIIAGRLARRADWSEGTRPRPY